MEGGRRRGQRWRTIALLAWATAVAGCGGGEATAPTALPDANAPGPADTGKDAAAAADVAAADVAADIGKDVILPFDDHPPPPVAVKPPPPCTSTWTYALPATPPPDGLVGIEPSGRMIATGVTEKLSLVVILPGKPTLDTAAAGAFEVTSDPDVTVLGVDHAQGGIGAARIVIKTAGPHAIKAKFADGRAGTATFFAYATALPVWSVQLSETAWQDLVGNPYQKAYHACTLSVGAKALPAEIRLHGGTSADLAKKSFRINLKKGAALADGRRELIVRSEYIDKTLMRTWLGYEAIRQATWLPAPASEFIHLRINDRFYGVMHTVERIDDQYLKARGRDPDGVLYEGDPPHELAAPGANLTKVFPADNYKKIYQKHGGPDSWSDLIALIEDVLVRPDAQLFATLDQTARVRDWIEYAAVMTVLQNQEHIRKNWYIYRNPKGKDDRFEWFAWDLDVTWGHLWSEKNDVFDEAISAALPPDKGSAKVDPVFFNQMYRVLDHPPWRALWAQRVIAIAALVLDDAFLQPRIDWLLCRLTPDLLADARKRATDAEFQSRVGELKTFAVQRRAFLQGALGPK